MQHHTALGIISANILLSSRHQEITPTNIQFAVFGAGGVHITCRRDASTATKHAHQLPVGSKQDIPQEYAFITQRDKCILFRQIFESDIN